MGYTRATRGWIHQINARIGRNQIGIAAEVLIVQCTMPTRLQVSSAKPVPPVIAASPILCHTRLCFQFSRLGTNAKVPRVNIDLSTALDRRDDPAVVAVGPVDPVVQAPPQCIDLMLRIRHDKTVVEHFLSIGSSVPVGIFRVQDIGRTRDQHATLPGHDPGREIQSLQKHGRPVIPAVPVGVLQKPNASLGLGRRVTPLGIVPHFDDPQPSVRPPVNRDRIAHQRLAADQFHPTSRAHFQAG